MRCDTPLKSTVSCHLTKPRVPPVVLIEFFDGRVVLGGRLDATRKRPCQPKCLWYAFGFNILSASCLSRWGFRAWPFAWYCGGRDFPAHSLIFRMSRFQDRPFLLAWLLVPYHRQCHGLRRWCAISSTWLDHGISCLFRGRPAGNPPNPAADRQTSLGIPSHMRSQITPSHRQRSLRHASCFRSHLL
jgi:hypothetical protein